MEPIEYYARVWCALRKDYGLTWSMLADQGRNREAAELIVSLSLDGLAPRAAAFHVANAMRERAHA